MNLQGVEGQTSLGTPTGARPVGIPMLVPAGWGGALRAVSSPLSRSALFRSMHWQNPRCLFFFFLFFFNCQMHGSNLLFYAQSHSIVISDSEQTVKENVFRNVSVHNQCYMLQCISYLLRFSFSKLETNECKTSLKIYAIQVFSSFSCFCFFSSSFFNADLKILTNKICQNRMSKKVCTVANS